MLTLGALAFIAVAFAVVALLPALLAGTERQTADEVSLREYATSG